jgi:hypothetical protein
VGSRKTNGLLHPTRSAVFKQHVIVYIRVYLTRCMWLQPAARLDPLLSSCEDSIYARSMLTMRFTPNSIIKSLQSFRASSGCLTQVERTLCHWSLTAINAMEVRNSRRRTSHSYIASYKQCSIVNTRVQTFLSNHDDPTLTLPQLRQMTFSPQLSFGDFSTHADTGNLFPSKAKTVR